MLAWNVDGIAPGAYHYDSATHELVDLRRSVSAYDIPALLAHQSYFAGAGAAVVMCPVFARTMWRYGHSRAYRMVLIDAGHLGQTFCLVATALGLAPFTTMAFSESKLEALLGLDGVRECPIYVAGVGMPDAGAGASPLAGGHAAGKARRCDKAFNQHCTSRIRAVPLTPNSLFEWVLAGAGGSTLLVFALALQNFFIQPATLTRQQRVFQNFGIVLGLAARRGAAHPEYRRPDVGRHRHRHVCRGVGVVSQRDRSRAPGPDDARVRLRAALQSHSEDRPVPVIRHPIYVSYWVAWLAAPVATHNLVLLATAIFMIGCYCASAAEEERLLLSGPLADEYRKHLESTRRFIPVHLLTSLSGQRFNPGPVFRPWNFRRSC